MNKIESKSIITAIIMLIFFFNIAYAADVKLAFKDVDVKVGGRTDKNLKDGDSISEEANPGDTIEVKVEVESLFNSSDDVKIENIDVEVTILEIDDGDDLSETAKDFDLRPGRDKRVTLKFKIPLEVEEDDFDVEIIAEGEDESGTEHRIEMILSLEVEKDRDRLEITRNTLSPAEVSCSKRNVQLAATLINIGTKDQDDVTIQVLNNDLEIDLEDRITELLAEPNEDESRYSNIFTFNIDKDARVGSYPILLRASYADGRKKAEKSTTLTVLECSSSPNSKNNQNQVQEEVESFYETIEIPAPVTTTQIFVHDIEDGTTVSKESFGQSAFVVTIIAAEIIAVIIGIVLAAFLFMRRN